MDKSSQTSRRIGPVMLVYFLAGLSFVPVLGAKEIKKNPIDPGDVIKKYNNAECCIYVDDMDSIEFAEKDKLTIDLANSNRLLELSTGPTFAKLISLPKSDENKEYRLRTNVIEHKDNKYAFFPFLALLDQNRNLIGTTGFTKMSYETGYFLNPDKYIYIDFEIAGDDPDSRYLLVYTRPKYFTRLSPESLHAPPRNIQINEVPSRLNKIVSDYGTAIDIIYGLPASVITITMQNKWFN